HRELAMTENGLATSRELGRPHPEERACRKGCANSNGRARVSKDEDGTRSRVYPRSAELSAKSAIADLGVHGPHASRRIAAHLGCGSACARVRLRRSSA